MSGISINKNIYALLSKDEELSKSVSGQIYPLIAKANTSFPFVIFKRNNLSPTYTKDINVSDTVSVSISIVAKEYFESVEITERVRTILENKRTQEIRSIRLLSATEDFVDDAYVQELEFEIKI